MRSLDQLSVAEQKTLMKKRQNWSIARRLKLALPILPPASEKARKKIYAIIRDTGSITAGNARKIAQQWNLEADGKDLFYITPEMVKALGEQQKKRVNREETEVMARTAIAQLDNSLRTANRQADHFPGALAQQEGYRHLPDVVLPAIRPATSTALATSVPRPSTQPSAQVARPPGGSDAPSGELTALFLQLWLRLTRFAAGSSKSKRGKRERYTDEYVEHVLYRLNWLTCLTGPAL